MRPDLVPGNPPASPSRHRSAAICLLAASWQCDLHRRPMPNPTTAIPSPDVRRRSDCLPPLERLFVETAPLRRSAVWRKARWIPDAAAAVDAAVWEAIHTGVTDSQKLYDVARYAAVAQRRYEMRQRRRPPRTALDPTDPAERAVEMAHAERQVRQLLSMVPAPSPAVTAWLDRKTGRSLGVPLPSRVKTAGGRWAARARRELGDCDEVA